jgi:RNA polymerase sigma-70 factor (ECF subfamily)
MVSSEQFFPFNKIRRPRIQKGRAVREPAMEPGSEPDETLMGQVALGKRDSLELLIRRHASSLLSFLQRMIGDRHRGEELFQEVFLTVWLKRERYQTSRPFKPWLYTIALNKCRAACRGRSAAPAVSLDEGSPATPQTPDASPADKAIATETAALVAAAVAHLPARQRAVVVLRIWEGLSYEAIAAIVGRSEATVRSHMHHGLARLRKYLEPRLG